MDVELVLLDDEHRARDFPNDVYIHQLEANRSLFSSLKQFHKLVTKEKPDLVVSFLVRANICNALTGIFNRNKTVLCERMHLSSHLDNQFSGIKRSLAGFLPYFSYRFANAVVGVSGGVTSDLIENFNVSRRKAHTIFNPYDIDAIRASSSHTPEFPLPSEFVISAGRLTEAKNFKQLIYAYLNSNEQVPLCILGEGEQKKELQKLIVELNAQKKIILLGYTNNPFAIFARAKYYISASTNEGFPNALVEAMAIGLPVAMTNCPSGPAEILQKNQHFFSETVHHSKYGLLIPLRDEAQLTSAINQLRDEGLLEHYSKQSANRAKDFAISEIASEYWSFLKLFI